MPTYAELWALYMELWLAYTKLTPEQKKSGIGWEMKLRMQFIKEEMEKCK